MEEAKAEILRLRERQHEIGSELAAIRLDFADLRSEIRQLNAQADKYIPIVERLDDAGIAEKATVEATAREASKLATRTVAIVSVIGVTANVLVSVLRVWLG